MTADVDLVAADGVATEAAEPPAHSWRVVRANT